MIFNLIIYLLLIILSYILIIKIIKFYKKKIQNYSFYHIIKKNKIDNIVINKKIKIAFLVPSTSNKRDYKNYDDCDFIRILLSSFIYTYNSKNSFFEYTFYLGHDYDDKFYVKNKEKIINYVKSLNLNIKIKIIEINLKERGHLSEIWNILFKNAIDDDNDYFYQLGDDIRIIDSDWEIKFISQLKKYNNIGVIGPLDLNNDGLLTQSFVHKTHFNIFGYYFPKIIKNLYVDNWIEHVYKSFFNNNRSFKVDDLRVINSGGPQRYNNPKKYEMLKSYHEALKEGKQIYNNYINNLPN